MRPKHIQHSQHNQHNVTLPRELRWRPAGIMQDLQSCKPGASTLRYTITKLWSMRLVRALDGPDGLGLDSVVAASAWDGGCIALR